MFPSAIADNSIQWVISYKKPNHTPLYTFTLPLTCADRRQDREA